MLSKYIGKKPLHNKYYLLFTTAFFLFIGKWIFSYHFFDNDIGIRVIFENPGDGFYYFPYVKYLATLNLSPSFDPSIENLKNISIPFYGILVHSIFYKIFGNYSFIILEFFFIFLFLIIFFHIFQKFKFSDLASIILSLFLIILPGLTEFLDINKIIYLSRVSDFYNLRFQNRLVVGIFFFIFVLFLINLNDKKIFQFKNFVFLGILFSFSFTAYYYYFIVQVLGFLFFLIYKLNFNIKEIFVSKIKFYFATIITFFIFSLPFLLVLFNVEQDYSERLCVIDLTVSRKLILIDYLFKGIIKKEFLLAFLFISSFTYYLNKKKIVNYQLNNIIYLVFLSSILSPFVFILFSPKTCVVYHFNNIIFQSAVLCIVFLFLNLSKNYFYMFFNFKKFNRIISITLIISLIIFYNFNIFLNQKSNYEDQNYKGHRNYVDLIAKDLKKLKKTNANPSILTLDPRLMVWSVMNDVEDIRLISGQIVPKTNEMLENDLISTFKFFDKSDDEFINFFKNKKAKWRYLNQNTQLFFWMRYSANSLKTYKDSKNFDDETLKFIEDTSPLHAQSLIIPKNEFERLRLKFQNFEKKFFKKPTIISLNDKSFLLNEEQILNKNYCIYKNYKRYITYKLKNSKDLCRKLND